MVKDKYDPKFIYVSHDIISGLKPNECKVYLHIIVNTDYSRRLFECSGVEECAKINLDRLTWSVALRGLAEKKVIALETSNHGTKIELLKFYNPF